MKAKHVASKLEAEWTDIAETKLEDHHIELSLAEVITDEIKTNTTYINQKHDQDEWLPTAWTTKTIESCEYADHDDPNLIATYAIGNINFDVETIQIKTIHTEIAQPVSALTL